jgi:hypothetical protein
MTTTTELPSHDLFSGLSSDDLRSELTRRHEGRMVDPRFCSVAVALSQYADHDLKAELARRVFGSNR